MDAALKEDVIIARRNGPKFRIVPIKDEKKRSPLDIKGIRTSITMKDILEVLDEVRNDTP
jgi:antitoxin (DNA-binding transcriptional repressor) of toxin-antitoxin stability system